MSSLKWYGRWELNFQEVHLCRNDVQLEEKGLDLMVSQQMGYEISECHLPMSPCTPHSLPYQSRLVKLHSDLNYSRSLFDIPCFYDCHNQLVFPFC